MIVISCAGEIDTTTAWLPPARRKKVTTYLHSVQLTISDNPAPATLGDVLLIFRYV